MSTLRLRLIEDMRLAGAPVYYVEDGEPPPRSHEIEELSYRRPRRRSAAALPRGEAVPPDDRDGQIVVEVHERIEPEEDESPKVASLSGANVTATLTMPSNHAE
jgi:hypothetical protein